ncbi:MAG: hypothetical protein EXQ48_05105 [Acidobacteria bacterium]|nr:hypothetical protein [Acidobacteriota bacterium]
MRLPLPILLILLTGSSTADAQVPSIRAGEWLRVDFRVRVQGDMRASQASSADKADEEDGRLDIARRRVGIEGRAARVFDYQMEYELGARQWRDVYLDYRQFKALQLRAGTFKLPFGLDENTSATSLDFIYRSRISSRLAPGRGRRTAPACSAGARVPRASPCGHFAVRKPPRRASTSVRPSCSRTCRWASRRCGHGRCSARRSSTPTSGSRGAACAPVSKRAGRRGWSRCSRSTSA